MYKIGFIVLVIFHYLMPSSNAAAIDSIKKTSEFATELYHKCAEKSGEKNVIISPLSVSTALALLSQGAKKATFDQLVHGLHLSNDKSAIAADYANHINTFNARLGDATLSIANQLYVKHGVSIKQSFKDVAVHSFNSGIETLNFADGAAATATINKFVEDKTNGKIKDLFQPGSLSADTNLVLVNAIHFKGIWQEHFKIHETVADIFFMDATNTKSVDFMHISDDFRYATIDELDATVAELKYYNSNVSFIVVLPNKKDGLTALESALVNYDLTKITSQLHTQYLEIILPKFKFEYKIELNEVLQQLGMTDMFGPNADLSDILETTEPVKVSKVIHKAFIDVNEVGTEAAAATGLNIVPLSLNIRTDEKKIFKADHPFVFYIMDPEQNTVVFSGRYAQ